MRLTLVSKPLTRPHKIKDVCDSLSVTGNPLSSVTCDPFSSVTCMVTLGRTNLYSRVVKLSQSVSLLDELKGRLEDFSKYKSSFSSGQYPTLFNNYVFTQDSIVLVFDSINQLL